MPSIRFFQEETTYQLKNKNKVKQWLKAAVAAEGFKLNELNYIFCSDAYLLQINRQYLNHDTYTDIITFDNAEKERVITGDIFISAERIAENARKFGVTTEGEMHRVIIHGALHLLGYKDKTPAHKHQMTEKENFYLAALHFD